MLFPGLAVECIGSTLFAWYQMENSGVPESIAFFLHGLTESGAVQVGKVLRPTQAKIQISCYPDLMNRCLF